MIGNGTLLPFVTVCLWAEKTLKGHSKGSAGFRRCRP